MGSSHKHIDKSTAKGSILSIRALEDCIRCANKYTKGVFRKATKHPVQGEEFPGRVLTEYYEVYPKTEISWNMPASRALDWLWGEVPIVHVFFRYDYRGNEASMNVRSGPGVSSRVQALKMLKENIPGFAEALDTVRVVAAQVVNSAEATALPNTSKCRMSEELSLHKPASQSIDK